MDFSSYMQRAIDLARLGEGHVSPNPMVGAVIVAPDGCIIGEGWHRQFGSAHAEVNACNSVATENLTLLHDSTIFVTLEPCAHFGKTPPCADLIVNKRFKRLVVASVDPFHKVSGKGLERIKQAGIEVITGILDKENRDLNKTFFFAHTHHRPYVTLKWAQSLDGWLDSSINHPYSFSTEISKTLVHRLRANNDAILTSTVTVKNDNPLLNVRIEGYEKHPLKVIIGRTELSTGYNVYRGEKPIHFKSHNLENILKTLYEQYNVTSVLVEAGSKLLEAFIEQNLWNEARVEIAPVFLGTSGIKKAPLITGQPIESSLVGQNRILNYINN